MYVFVYLPDELLIVFLNAVYAAVVVVDVGFENLLAVFLFEHFSLLNELAHHHQQFVGDERLAKVNLGSCVKASETVVVFGACRYNNNRYVVGLFVSSQCLYKLYAVHLRHHYVGDDELRVFLLYNFEGFLAVLCPVVAVALVLEHLCYQQGNIIVILGKQHVFVQVTPPYL